VFSIFCFGILAGYFGFIPTTINSNAWGGRAPNQIFAEVLEDAQPAIVRLAIIGEGVDSASDVCDALNCGIGFRSIPTSDRP
jgi:hypothetical protein